MMTAFDTSRPYPLTWEDLEAYQPSKTRPRDRYFCPVHGGDKQPSIIVDTRHPQTRWKCMNCSTWGYLNPDQSWKPEPKPRTYQQRAAKKKPQAPQTSTAEAPALNFEALANTQNALPGSPGERYLKARGISLETAQKYGIGFSPSGSPLKPWKWGRVLIPHTNPEGQIISLYGRAIDGISDKQAPKELKHMHLQGKKGIFNAQALKQPAVFICEGAFDALALLEAGYPAVALYGLSGLPWQWVEAQELIFCLDSDQAGSSAVYRLAEEAEELGKDVYRYILPVDCKDANEAWVSGKLKVLAHLPPDLHLWMLGNWQGIYLTPDNAEELQPLYDALEAPEEYQALAAKYVKA